MRTGENTLENCLILYVVSSIICKGSIYIIVKMFFLLLKTRNMHKEETGFFIQSSHPSPTYLCLLAVAKRKLLRTSTPSFTAWAVANKIFIMWFGLRDRQDQTSCQELPCPHAVSEEGQPNRSEVVIVPVLCLEHLLSLLR